MLTASNTVDLMIDSKQSGEESEVAFALRALRHGFIVSRPIGESSKYDVIVDSGGRLSRVQVKCSSKAKSLDDNRYLVTLTSGGKRNRKCYSDRDTDFMAIHLQADDVWYILPIAELENIRSISLRPRYDTISRFNKFEEAWYLFYPDAWNKPRSSTTSPPILVPNPPDA